jgi:hypothetical protein
MGPRKLQFKGNVSAKPCGPCRMKRQVVEINRSVVMSAQSYPFLKSVVDLDGF